MRLLKGLICVSLALPALADVPAEPSRKENPVLARVNGEPVTLAEMRAEFTQRHQGHMVLLGDEDVVREFLDDAVRRRLFIQEGYRLGLQDDPEVAAYIVGERARIAGEWLFASEIEGRVELDPAAVDLALSRVGVLYEVVLIQTDRPEQAEAARGRVLEGEDAETVAREVSTARSRTRGGLDGVAWGQADVALEEAVFATEPGDVTPVIESEDGFVFAVVRDRRQAEFDNLEAARPRVEEILRLRAVGLRRIEYLDQLGQRYHARMYPERIRPESILPLLDAAAGEGGTGANPIVAEYDGGRILRSEFVTTIRPRAFRELAPAAQKRQARRLLENRLDERLIRLEGQRRWDEAPAADRVKLQTIQDDLVYRVLLGRYVFEGVEASNEEIDTWYDAHREDYVEPTRIRLAIALLDSREEAEALLARAQAGDDFGELARTQSKDRETAKRDGVAGWVSQAGAIPELRGAAFELPAGSTAGPVEIDKGWLVYRILERVEARPLPLAEVREKVEARVMEQQTGDRMIEWESRLWQDGDVKLLDKGIRKASRILGEESETRLQERAPETEAPGRNPHGGMQ